MSTTKRTSKKSGRSTSRAAKTTKTNNRSRKTVKGKACAAPNKFFCGLTVAIIAVAATVFITMFTMFVLAGCLKFQNAQSDAERFASEYSTVARDNPFVYKSAQDIIDVIEHGTGVVFLGFPSCPWCQAYAGTLANVAKNNGLDKIYYYNIYDARQNNTEDYQKLVTLLGANLQYDEDGHRRIYVPDVVFVIDGRIIGNDLETSKDTAGESDPAAYWTEARKSALESRLNAYTKQVVDATGNCSETCNN